MTYRGWEIERVVGATNIGYRDSTVVRAGTSEVKTVHHFRKVSGYYVHYPDGGSRWCDTLKDAKRYIDRYLDRIGGALTT